MSRDDNEDSESLYTTASEYDNSAYNISNPGDDGYDDEEFDDIDPDFEEHVDSAPSAKGTKMFKLTYVAFGCSFYYFLNAKSTN